MWLIDFHKSPKNSPESTEQNFLILYQNTILPVFVCQIFYITTWWIRQILDTCYHFFFSDDVWHHEDKKRKWKCPYLVSITFNITLQKGQIEQRHLYSRQKSQTSNVDDGGQYWICLENYLIVNWFSEAWGKGGLEGTTWQKLNKTLKHERKFHIKAQDSRWANHSWLLWTNSHASQSKANILIKGQNKDEKDKQEIS